MAVKIKLKRMGKIRTPQYRIVVADARTKRDGKAIEQIGIYHPQEEPSLIKVNSERAQYWLSVGAQPTDPVRHLLKLTGDWQKFRGLPAPPPLKVAEPKPDQEARFQAVLKELVLPESGEGNKTAKAKKSEKSEEKPAAAEKADADAEAGSSAETGEKPAEGEA